MCRIVASFLSRDAGKEIGIRSRLGVYSASKFGLIGYSLALYKELIDYGVKVTALSPNYMPTDLTKKVPIDREDMIQLEDITKTIDYLLNLSSNAAVRGVVIECSEKVKRQNQKE